MFEQAAVDDGEYPDKKYIDKLLEDVETRSALFEYESIQPGTHLDTQKLNKDLFYIKKDLEILYEIVSELAGEKYAKLEAYVNGYLSSLEENADEAEARAREDYEGTSLGAKTAYFKQGLPDVSFENDAAVLFLGPVTCSSDSYVYGVINGYGFLQNDVVFDFDGKRISPYSVNRETLRTSSSTKKTAYTYQLPDNSPYRSTFKIANSSIAVDEGHRYEAYGGADKISCKKADENTLLSFLPGKSFYSSSESCYVFYLMNATRIRFDFSKRPSSRNFAEDDEASLRRDSVYKYELVMPKGSSFNIETDGIVYATKEKLAINGNELYVSGYTPAKDFLIYAYEPGNPVTFKNVKAYIYGAQEDAFSISSIAIKEYAEENL